MGGDGHSLSTGMGRHITQGPVIGHWVAQRVRGQYFEANSQAIGLMKDGKIIAGVIYENFNGRSVVAHIAIEGSINREFLYAIFHYPFTACGVEKIIAPVPGSNGKSIRLATNMGFWPEARLRDAHPDGDILLMTLEKADCRFLGDARYGKKFTIAAAAA